MKVTAKLNDLRIAPRKVRLIADIIRNKKIEEARSILNFSIKKGSLPLLKLLNSAVSNASNAFQLDSNNLYIYKITVDEGRKLKRWMPRARGSAAQIQKKTSLITLVLDEINSTKADKKKKAVVRAQAKKEEVREIASNEAIEDKGKKPGYFKKQKVQEINMLKTKNVGGTNKMFRRKSV